MMEPSPNGTNGRAGNGRFGKGNPGGPGNPFARRVGALRAAMLDAVTDDDLRDIIATLVSQAKGGDLAAIRELLDRLIGKPTAAVAFEVTTGETSLAAAPIEERRERLKAIAERLGLRGEFNPPSELRQELLTHPRYLEFIREGASRPDDQIH